MEEPKDTGKQKDPDNQHPWIDPREIQRSIEGDPRQNERHRARTPEEEIDEAPKAFGDNLREKFKTAGLGESVTAIATVVLAVAGVVGLFIYGGQLREMKRSTIATQQAAYAACVSSQISRNSLIEVQKGESDTHKLVDAAVYQAIAATQSESANIEMNISGAQVRAGDIIRVPFSIVNAGRGPANEVPPNHARRVFAEEYRSRFLVSQDWSQ